MFRYVRSIVGQDPTVTLQLKEVLIIIGDNTYSAKEIMEFMGLRDKSNFLKNYLYS
ncbi:MULTISPECIES: Fic family protein [Butyricimonas]|uniref:Fic family protein n=1 Tax=Butyricimonas TaxID=574697 RepID=UPI0031381E55